MASIEKKELLIEFVKNHPELFDKSHAKYKDATHCQILWNRAAREFDFKGISYFYSLKQFFR